MRKSKTGSDVEKTPPKRKPRKKTPEPSPPVVLAPPKTLFSLKKRDSSGRDDFSGMFTLFGPTRERVQELLSDPGLREKYQTSPEVFFDALKNSLVFGSENALDPTNSVLPTDVWDTFSPPVKEAVVNLVLASARVPEEDLISILRSLSLAFRNSR